MTAGTTVGSIAGAGLYRIGSKQLTVGTANLSTTVSGIIADGGAAGGTGGSLVKVGGGTLTLAGANTYTGGTTINEGSLVVNGSLASGVTMNGGTLGGSGSVAGLVVNSGTLAPGNSIGTLRVNGNLVQGAGTTYQVEVNAAGQGDRINVGGTATINGGTVQVLAQVGHLRPQHHLHHPARDWRRVGRVLGCHQQLRLPYAVPLCVNCANDVFLLLSMAGPAFSSVGGLLDRRGQMAGASTVASMRRAATSAAC